MWKAVFDKSRMYGLEGDLSYLSRSTQQYVVKKPKETILALIKRKLVLEPLSRSCHVKVLQKKKLQNPIQFIYKWMSVSCLPHIHIWSCNNEINEDNSLNPSIDLWPQTKWSFVFPFGIMASQIMFVKTSMVMSLLIWNSDHCIFGNA